MEFPGDNILPTGYNVTIACISNSSRKEPGYLDKPYWIQYYLNDVKKLLHGCGGSDGSVDSEASKVCKFFIQNATEKHSGNYSCWAYTQGGCTRRKIELEFRGRFYHFSPFFINSISVRPLEPKGAKG